LFTVGVLWIGKFVLVVLPVARSLCAVSVNTVTVTILKTRIGGVLSLGIGLRLGVKIQKKV
jgi:hypothetical protein